MDTAAVYLKPVVQRQLRVKFLVIGEDRRETLVKALGANNSGRTDLEAIRCVRLLTSSNAEFTDRSWCVAHREQTDYGNDILIFWTNKETGDYATGFTLVRIDRANMLQEIQPEPVSLIFTQPAYGAGDSLVIAAAYKKLDALNH